MSRNKIPVPDELRAGLNKIALATDCIAEHKNIDLWRIEAITAARWLIFCAANSEELSTCNKLAIREVKRLMENTIAGRQDP